MNLQDAKAIYLGNKQIKEIRLGDRLIWPESGKTIPKLPEEYQLLTAIMGKAEGDLRAPSISTEYPYSHNTKFVLKCSVQRTSANESTILHGPNTYWRVVAGVAGTTEYNSMPAYFNIHTENSSFNGIKSGTTPMTWDKIYTVTCEKDYVSFDDGSVVNTAYCVEFNGTEPVYLPDHIEVEPGQGLDWVTHAYIGIAALNNPDMTIYSCMIYENGVLVRNFVPAYHNPTGRVGLYDTITNRFHTQFAPHYQNAFIPVGLELDHSEPEMLPFSEGLTDYFDCLSGLTESAWKNQLPGNSGDMPDVVWKNMTIHSDGSARVEGNAESYGEITPVYVHTVNPYIIYAIFKAESAGESYIIGNGVYNAISQTPAFGIGISDGEIAIFYRNPTNGTIGFIKSGVSALAYHIVTLLCDPVDGTQCYATLYVDGVKSAEGLVVGFTRGPNWGLGALVDVDHNAVQIQPCRQQFKLLAFGDTLHTEEQIIENCTLLKELYGLA